MAFNLVPGALSNLIDRALDPRMRETANIGRSTMLAHVHRVTGYLASTIGSEYDQRRKVAMVHVDAPYGLIEAARGGAHDFITPGCRAMGRIWGGNFEVHLPNAAPGRGLIGEARNRARVGKLQAAMGRAGRKGTFHVRRWHKRIDPTAADPTTPIL